MCRMRGPWLDVAKGIAIIIVVYVHTGLYPIDPYLRWVQMPIFFVIAGYLFHPRGGYIKNRAKRLLLPWLIFVILFYLAFRGDLIKGEGDYIVLWFPVCLFIVQAAFSYVTLLDYRLQAAIIIICFISAHFIPHLLPPWGVDAALAAIYFYSIGFYAKDYLKNRKIWVLCLVLLLPFIIAQQQGFAYNSLDMKYLYYPNIYFDATVPIIASVVLLGLAGLLRNSRLLQIIGSQSMMIMYLQIPILMHFPLYLPFSRNVSLVIG